MNRSTKILWGALALVIVLLAVWQRYPLADATTRLRSLPVQGLLYSTREVPLNGAEEANFRDTTIIKRLAAVERTQVILTAVDGTRNRHAVHDPSFCFRGAGWEVASQERLPLEKGEARLVHLQQQEKTAEAVYWFSDGEEQFGNPLRYWWKTALRRLSLGRSGSEPVLVILSSTTARAPDWNAVLRAWPDLQRL